MSLNSYFIIKRTIRGEDVVDIFEDKDIALKRIFFYGDLMKDETNTISFLFRGETRELCGFEVINKESDLCTESYIIEKRPLGSHTISPTHFVVCKYSSDLSQIEQIICVCETEEKADDRVSKLNGGVTTPNSLYDYEKVWAC